MFSTWLHPGATRRQGGIGAGLARILMAVVAGSLSVHATLSHAQDAPVVPNWWAPEPRTDPPEAGAFSLIRFVTTDDHPPFSFVDAAGKLTGFDVDLARALCLKIGSECTIQVMPFHHLVDALEERTADVAIAGIAITAGTRAHMLFSDVYFRSPARFVAQKDTRVDATARGLEGRTIAVAARTAHEAFLRTFFTGSEMRAFPDEAAARRALKQGEADVLFGDGVALSFWISAEDSEGCCMFVGGPYLEPRFFGNGHAMALRPGEHRLKSAIDYGLRQIYEDGTYRDIYLRYFPVGLF